MDTKDTLFPMLVEFHDTKEKGVIKTANDIPPHRAFKVLERNTEHTGEIIYEIG